MMNADDIAVEECDGQINLLFPFRGYMCPQEDGGIRLSMIAVHPTMRGQGLFAGFIEDLKEEYNTIKMLVPLGSMKQVLEKWGFVEHTEFDESIGEDVIVMLWTGNDSEITSLAGNILSPLVNMWMKGLRRQRCILVYK